MKRRYLWMIPANLALALFFIHMNADAPLWKPLVDLFYAFWFTTKALDWIPGRRS